MDLLFHIYMLSFVDSYMCLIRDQMHHLGVSGCQDELPSQGCFFLSIRVPWLQWEVSSPDSDLLLKGSKHLWHKLKLKQFHHVGWTEGKRFRFYGTMEARQKRHIWMKKIGPGKCSFAKQHLNPKMPKCYFDIHFSEKDIYGLFDTMYVGKGGYNFSKKKYIQIFDHCTCTPVPMSLGTPFPLTAFP